MQNKPNSKSRVQERKKENKGDRVLMKKEGRSVEKKGKGEGGREEKGK